MASELAVQSHNGTIYATQYVMLYSIPENNDQQMQCNFYSWVVFTIEILQFQKLFCCVEVGVRWVCLQPNNFQTNMNVLLYPYRPGLCDVGHQWQLCQGSHGFGQVTAQPQDVQEVGGTHRPPRLRPLPVSFRSTVTQHLWITTCNNCLVLFVTTNGLSSSNKT